MSSRFKYPTNGVYRIDNFAQRAEQNDFQRAPVGIAEGLDEWYICLVLRPNGNVYPLIYCEHDSTFTLRYFFNVIKKDGSSSFKTYGRRTSTFTAHCCSGLLMNTMDLLNLENGYLDEGTLSIEYGVHMEGFPGKNGIWKFCFSDTFFEGGDFLTIKYNLMKNRKVFYAPRQLLVIHNPQFKDENVEFSAGLLKRKQIEKCLQMAHGVRIQLDADFSIILMIANWNQLRNVIQYADQKLVERYWSPWDKLAISFLFEECIRYGLRHLLAHFVRHFGSRRDLKSMIQQLDIEKMPGEAMKTFAAKIFELEY